MATATLANKQSSTAANSTLAKSPISNIARYETTSRARQGRVTQCRKWQTIPSRKNTWPGSQNHHYCELTIHSEKHGEINIVVFEDQGPEIWSLASLQQDDIITVVLCDYTSKSGRFRDTNRIWKIIPQSAANHARLAQTVGSGGLLIRTQPSAVKALAATTSRVLLSHSTHQWKQDLNKPEAYINF